MHIKKANQFKQQFSSIYSMFSQKDHYLKASHKIWAYTKQHSKINYLGGQLDEAMSGEAMTLNVINKIKIKLNFFHCMNCFLTSALRRLLCKASIQPHFDYSCCIWYPNLTKKLKHRIQTTQNKCVRFRALKAFIKPLEAPQKSVKVKVYLNFYFNTTFRNERVFKG